VNTLLALSTYIAYEVIGQPPSMGFCHSILIDVLEKAVTFGALKADGVVHALSLATCDYCPSPLKLTAVT
jgi:hypothetical protein